MPYTKIGGMAEVTVGEKVACDCPWVILTMDNELIFLGDFTVSDNTEANMMLFTLPKGYRPKKDMLMQIGCLKTETSTDVGMATVKFGADGKVITTSKPISATASYLLRNRSVCIADAFYNAELGNLTTVKTSDW